MKAKDLLSYMESHDYQEWFSNELIRMLHRTLIKARDEGLTIDDVIELLFSEME